MGVPANPFASSSSTAAAELSTAAGDDEQARAISAIRRWHKSKPRRQVYRMFGPAGTGKTTVARDVAAAVGGNVMFAAFSGKAAAVLRAKGCDNARTIHSLIYKPIDTKKGVEFILDENSVVRHASLLIIDECSMVDQRMGRDLESFGIPILVLGDKAQLPPISDTGYFTKRDADFKLTQIHRQDEQNPIIQLANSARAGKIPTKGILGTSKVITARELDYIEVLEADQILAGTWQKVTHLNARIREILGRPYGVPVAGDKLVCRKNNHGKGVLNGEVWFVSEITGTKSARISMMVTSEAGDREVAVSVNPTCFTLKDDQSLAHQRRLAKDHDVFTFGNVITVHQAQGSEWNHVVLFDESGKFGSQQFEWLYTGITRAAKSLTVVQP